MRYPAGYPAIKSGIRLDTGCKKRPDHMTGRISGASLVFRIRLVRLARILRSIQDQTGQTPPFYSGSDWSDSSILFRIRLDTG
jgi:hypothetical protein